MFFIDFFCGEINMYTKKVMEQFQKSDNHGEIKDADGIGKVGNAKCGDVMWIYLKVERYYH